MFLKITIIAYGISSECQFYPRKEQNLKRETPEEQQRHDLGAPQTGAIFVLNLQKMCVFQLPNWVRKIWGPNNNYY